eukprot:TRINITY_DN24287_c0_g1_i4.p1 TRINITY_DN24287_c0_g1~~TRINITY_DN24287_c0_g1_i4.p1  ORF type:complete len:179 (-),score=28.52 TRINITY_DN24287_c0_g1_i4:497-1033(-)
MVMLRLSVLSMLLASSVGFVCPPNHKFEYKNHGQVCGGTCSNNGRCKLGLHCQLEDPGMAHMFLGVARNGVCVHKEEAISVNVVTRATPEGTSQSVQVRNDVCLRTVETCTLRCQVSADTTIGQLKLELSPYFRAIVRPAGTFEDGFADTQKISELASEGKAPALEVVISDMMRGSPH